MSARISVRVGIPSAGQRSDMAEVAVAGQSAPSARRLSSRDECIAVPLIRQITTRSAAVDGSPVLGVPDGSINNSSASSVANG